MTGRNPLKQTILIIEDDAAYASLLQARLEAANFNVVTALEGREGLAKARATRPHLILLDIMLPGMDGGDVAHAIRNEAALKHIPIVFLTSAISAAESNSRWGQGNEHYLSKSMDHKVVLQRIREMLDA